MMFLQVADAVSPDEITVMVKALIAAVQSSNWALVGGLGITVLVTVARMLKLLDWVPTSAMKWVAGGMALLGGIASHLIAGNIDVVQMLVSSISLGVTAVGGWEMILKPLLAKVKKE